MPGSLRHRRGADREAFAKDQNGFGPGSSGFVVPLWLGKKFDPSIVVITSDMGVETHIGFKI